jgi:transcriptional regulator with GAF, ATPase, and Fis domain
MVGLFLDEVGELPLRLQSKLLRVLQEGSLSGWGAARRSRWMWVIAATNRNLSEAAQRGDFAPIYTID